MRTRQIYTANPLPPYTMADFSFGIRGVKALMRPADIRRFDIIMCASRDEVPVKEINQLRACLPSAQAGGTLSAGAAANYAGTSESIHRTCMDPIA